MYAYFGMMPPPMFGGVEEVVIDDPPVFTAQPQTQALYQDGGKLDITGAAVSGATLLQWQRQSGDDWVDVSGQTSAALSRTAAAADEGSYRLKAVNGNSVAVYSSEVDVVCAYLKFTNDSGGGTVTQSSRTAYSYANTAGAWRYISWFFSRWRDDSNLMPAGVTANRAPVKWGSIPNPPVSASQINASNSQMNATLVAGSGSTSASWGNLKSTVTINVT